MSTMTSPATAAVQEPVVAKLAYVGTNMECVPHLPQFMGVAANTPVLTFAPDQVSVDKASLVGATFDKSGKLTGFTHITVKVALIVGQNEPMPGQAKGSNHSARGNITLPADSCSPELIEYAMLHDGIQNGFAVPGAGLKRNAKGRYESGSGWYLLTFTGEAVFAIGEQTVREIEEDGQAKQVLSSPLLDSAFNSITFTRIVTPGNDTGYRPGWVGGTSANVAAARPVPQTAAPTPGVPAPVAQEPNLQGM